MSMSDLNLDKNKTLCVTGHRNFYQPIDQEALSELFISYIDKGYDTFLVGMAVGFDTFCFKALEKIREKKNVRIIACIPCPEQDKYFSLEQKKTYRQMLASADCIITLSPKYNSYCMLKRNRYMVDNSSVLIGYLVENKGGTKYTVNYAKEKGLDCIILPRYLEK